MAQAKLVNKILTANRLRNGETVYYTAAGAWSPYVAEAKVATSAEDADALAKIGAAAYAANLVVDVNVIDVTPGAEVKPAHIREVIRATGPTVRADLNKPVTPPQR
jgi:Protein of unknown function (DUF2849)